MNRPPNVTSINELMDIDEIEYQQYRNQNLNSQIGGSNSGQRHSTYGSAYANPDIGREDNNRYNKFIRNNNFNKIPEDAGMNFSKSNPYINSSSQYYQSSNPLREQSSFLNENEIDNSSFMINQNKYPDHLSNTTCIQVAEHIRDCPICCKFYKNDNTVYIIVIIILSIMCLLLLKRVLDI